MKDMNYGFDEYIRDTVPDRSLRYQSWKIAIGFQKMEGLTVSPYLMETAGKHIEGKIDFTTAKQRIDSYHKTHGESTDTIEADMVSVRIVEILCEKAFSLRPQELISIHERLFTSIYDHAGKFRNCNVTKHEWVLDGYTFPYASYETLASTLDDLFREERSFSYDISLSEASRHIASFISGIWQIHPFAEGNGKTVAIFLIKYLQYLGFDMDSDVFAEHSSYFRNALVRAAYQNRKKGICRNTVYLELFFDNLLFGATHGLKNRRLHVNYGISVNVSVRDDFPFGDFN